MNPQLLTLALTAPLEQLLQLPNAVRIAASAREDLQRFSHEQLQDILACIDAMITDTVALDQSTYGGLIKRDEQRDLNWYLEATHRGQRLTPKSGPKVNERDDLRVLALYKLGEVIDATADAPPVAFIGPVVATLKTLVSKRWRMLAGMDSQRWRADGVKSGSDSTPMAHSSNRSERVPMRTKMTVLPSS
jgi:hypothetical protein